MIVAQASFAERGLALTPSGNEVFVVAIEENRIQVQYTDGQVCWLSKNMLRPVRSIKVGR